MPLAVLCSPGSPPRRRIRFLAACRRGYPRVLCSLLYSAPLLHSRACCARLGPLPGAKGPTSGSIAAGGEPLHLLQLELGGGLSIYSHGNWGTTKIKPKHHRHCRSRWWCPRLQRSAAGIPGPPQARAIGPAGLRLFFFCEFAGLRLDRREGKERYGE
jgi:hypothetical protein